MSRRIVQVKQERAGHAWEKPQRRNVSWMSGSRNTRENAPQHVDKRQHDEPWNWQQPVSPERHLESSSSSDEGTSSHLGRNSRHVSWKEEEEEEVLSDASRWRINQEQEERERRLLVLQQQHDKQREIFLKHKRKEALERDRLRRQVEELRQQYSQHTDQCLARNDRERQVMGQALELVKTQQEVQLDLMRSLAEEKRGRRHSPRGGQPRSFSSLSSEFLVPPARALARGSHTSPAARNRYDDGDVLHSPPRNTNRTADRAEQPGAAVGSRVGPFVGRGVRKVAENVTEREEEEHAHSLQSPALGHLVSYPVSPFGLVQAQECQGQGGGDTGIGVLHLRVVGQISGGRGPRYVFALSQSGLVAAAPRQGVAIVYIKQHEGASWARAHPGLVFVGDEAAGEVEGSSRSYATQLSVGVSGLATLCLRLYSMRAADQARAALLADVEEVGEGEGGEGPWEGSSTKEGEAIRRFLERENKRLCIGQVSLEPGSLWENLSAARKDLAFVKQLRPSGQQQRQAPQPHRPQLMRPGSVTAVGLPQTLPRTAAPTHTNSSTSSPGVAARPSLKSPASLVGGSLRQSIDLQRGQQSPQHAESKEEEHFSEEDQGAEPSATQNEDVWGAQGFWWANKSVYANTEVGMLLLHCGIFDSHSDAFMQAHVTLEGLMFSPLQKIKKLVPNAHDRNRIREFFMELKRRDGGAGAAAAAVVNKIASNVVYPSSERGKSPRHAQFSRGARSSSSSSDYPSRPKRSSPARTARARSRTTNRAKPRSRGDCLAPDSTFPLPSLNLVQHTQASLSRAVSVARSVRSKSWRGMRFEAEDVEAQQQAISRHRSSQSKKLARKKARKSSRKKRKSKPLPEDPAVLDLLQKQNELLQQQLQLQMRVQGNHFRKNQDTAPEMNMAKKITVTLVPKSQGALAQAGAAEMMASKGTTPQKKRQARKIASKGNSESLKTEMEEEARKEDEAPAPAPAVEAKKSDPEDDDDGAELSGDKSEAEEVPKRGENNAVVLSMQDELVTKGETIVLKFVRSSRKTWNNDWVGLFLSKASDSAFVTKKALGPQAAGDLSFRSAALVAGSYEFRCFSGDGIRLSVVAFSVAAKTEMEPNKPEQNGGVAEQQPAVEKKKESKVDKKPKEKLTGYQLLLAKYCNHLGEDEDENQTDEDDKTEKAVSDKTEVAEENKSAAEKIEETEDQTSATLKEPKPSPESQALIATRVPTSVEIMAHEAAMAARVPLPAVTLEFSCSNLPCRSDKLESGTLPNPVVACFYKDEGKNKFAYLAKSDMVASTRDPEFDDLFDLQEVYDTTKIKMMIYDVDLPTDKVQTRHIIGEAVVAVTDLIDLKEAAKQARASGKKIGASKLVFITRKGREVRLEPGGKQACMLLSLHEEGDSSSTNTNSSEESASGSGDES